MTRTTGTASFLKLTYENILYLTTRHCYHAIYYNTLQGKLLNKNNDRHEEQLTRCQ